MLKISSWIILFSICGALCSNDKMEIIKETLGKNAELVCETPNGNRKIEFVTPSNERITNVQSSLVSKYSLEEQYDSSWRLIINDLTVEDAGIYLCKFGSSIQMKYNLIIQVPPKITRLSTVPSEVKEGDDVTIECEASGSPPPILAISALKASGIIYESVQGPVFILRNIRRSSLNSYECMASNDVPPRDVAILKIMPKFRPEIKISAKYDKNNSLVYLNCTVEAWPLDDFGWRLNGIKLQSRNYHLMRLKHNEYTTSLLLGIKKLNNTVITSALECTASNDLKTVKVFTRIEDWIFNKASHKRFRLRPASIYYSSGIQPNPDLLAVIPALCVICFLIN